MSTPSAAHWFGTDDFGRDLWTRVWWGTRISLFIGITAALIDLVVGVIYGGISAYYGGKVDEVMQRAIEIVYAIPFLLIAILLIMVIGSGISSIIMAYSITGWVPMARLVRGQMLTLKEQEFVLASRTLRCFTEENNYAQLDSKCTRYHYRTNYFCCSICDFY